MKKKTSLVVLHEDTGHHSLVNAYLDKKGYNISRKVHWRRAARGNVLKKYAEEVRDIRKYVAKNGPNARWLLVVTDADARTVEQRLKDLDSELQGNRKNSSDPIASLIPKRNIETWVWHLVRGFVEVSEEENYKLRVKDGECKKAGEQLANVDPRTRPNCPPSLCMGYVELQRIPK